jgi:type VI secretion system protein ImpA
MSDAPEPEFAPRPPVDDWLLPMDVGVGEDHSPWGPDLEYDPDMQALEQAAAGKPETQFAPAEPPDWNAVHEMAAALMRRTRDLRIAMHWCRAHVNLEGFEGVPPALCLLQGMLDNLWDGLHPMPDPDDGDTFARLSAIGGLDKLDGLLGDVRNALVTRDRRLAGLRVRGVEIATDRLPARPDEVGMSRAQIETALAELPEVAQALRAQCAEAQHWARRLSSVMNDRFGIGESVDLKRLRGMLTAIESVLPAVVEEVSTDEAIVDVEADLGDEGAPPAAATEPRGAKGVHSINSRAEAVRAIELVCAYLERSEPSNPAQLLLRRALRMIDRNFLQLVRDLAPDAVPEIARVMGIDPSDIGET